MHEMWYLQYARTIIYTHSIEGTHVWNANSFYQSVLWSLEFWEGKLVDKS